MKTEFDKYIIDRVREIRKERGDAQRDIAVTIHRSKTFVGQVESPNPKYPHKYSMYHIFLLAKDWEITVDEIFPPRNWEPSHNEEHQPPTKVKR